MFTSLCNTILLQLLTTDTLENRKSSISEQDKFFLVYLLCNTLLEIPLIRFPLITKRLIQQLILCCRLHMPSSSQTNQ